MARSDCLFLMAAVAALLSGPNVVEGFSQNHYSEKGLLSKNPTRSQFYVATKAMFPLSEQKRTPHHPMAHGRRQSAYTSKHAFSDKTTRSIYPSKNIRKLWLTLLGTLLWSIFPLRASASSLSNLWPKHFPIRRTSIRAAFAVLAITFIFRFIRLRRRQALDATSEWSRYANQ